MTLAVPFQNHGTIMVVEDDTDIRQSLASVVEAEGLRVLCAENGRAALNLLNSFSVLPQLILLDIMMPVMDGWQFLRERNHHPALLGVPVYVMSAIRDARLQEPAEGFLRKPIELDDLIGLIEKHCRS
ncbi:MAG: response regulator [Bdellovibrionota bacterium]